MPAQGLSLVEILIVVLIIGIMVAAAVPKYAHAVVRMRLDSAARRIAADLIAAQARARATSSSQTVQFTLPPEGSRYEIVGMKDPDHPIHSYTVNLAEAPYQVAFSLVDLGGDATVVFNGFGVPDSGGTLVLQAGQYTKTITIDPETGRPSVQ
ncbi:MAG: GspH/FimT family pseudopilin [Thermoguttaceae bacterium]